MRPQSTPIYESEFRSGPVKGYLKGILMTERVIRVFMNGILLGAIYGVLGMDFSMIYGIKRRT